MGFFIKVEYLQIIHYYFFFMGIFSITTSLIYQNLLPYYGILFAAFYAVHTGLSFYISLLIQRRVQGALPIQSKRSIGEHIVVAFYSFYLIFLLWYFNVLVPLAYMTAVMVINITILSAVLAWYILNAFGIFRGMFEFYGTFQLKRFQTEVLDQIEKTDAPLLRKTIKKYSPGSDGNIDYLLSLHSKTKSKQFLLEIVSIFFEKECFRLKKNAEQSHALKAQSEALINSLKSELKTIGRNASLE